MKRRGRPNPLEVSEIIRKLDEFREAGIGEGDKEFRRYFQRLYKHTNPRDGSEQFCQFGLPGDLDSLAPGQRVVSSDGGLEAIIDSRSLEVSDSVGRTVARDQYDYATDLDGAPPIPAEAKRFLKRFRAWNRLHRCMICPEPWMDVFYITPALVFRDFQRLCPLPENFLLNASNQMFAAQYFLVHGLEATWAFRRDTPGELRFFEDDGTPCFPTFWGPDRVSTTVAAAHGFIPALRRMLRIPTDSHGWPVGRPFDALGHLLYENGLYVPLKQSSGPPHRNVIREAVQKGIAKAMVLRDIAFRHDALRMEVDAASYIAEQYPKALESVKAGLREKAYARHPRSAASP